MSLKGNKKSKHLEGSLMEDEIKMEIVQNDVMNGMETEPDDFSIKTENNVEPSTEPQNSHYERKRTPITWPNEDLNELVMRLENCIPEDDSLNHLSRLDKIVWDNIAFKNYSAEECKTIWGLMRSKVRKFRILTEILNDVKVWINGSEDHSKPETKSKKKRHPDKPKRPLTAYLFFYLKIRDKIAAENPQLDMAQLTKIIGNLYKSLSPEKKLKYDIMAAKSKEEYDVKYKQFLESHPNLDLQGSSKSKAPKKPLSPFALYFNEELSKLSENDTERQHGFRDVCKEKWVKLSDKKKLTWINLAEEKVAQYKEAVRSYIVDHPDYVEPKFKPVLNKSEVMLKEKLAGKPIKPPMNAYSLFCQILLQSNKVKHVPVKERLNFVSIKWREATDEEKQKYKDLVTTMTHKFQEDLSSYLESLPEEQRQIELLKFKTRKRKSLDTDDKQSAKRPRGTKKTIDGSKSAKGKKFQEPETPPISAFKYFANKYSGELPVNKAWKALSADEKKTCETQLYKMKQEYIVAYEKFLKSLSETELQAYSTSREQANRIKNNQYPEEEEEEEDEEEESSSESGESEDDEDDEDSD